jgi:outer membrane protein
VKKIVTFWILSLVFASSRSAAARYTLEELLSKVATNSAGVVAARRSIEVADAQVSQANRLWAPSGFVNFGMTGSPEIRCADANGFVDPNQNVRQANCITTTGVDLQNTAGRLERVLPVHGVALNINLQLLQPLYTFGKIESAKEAARAGREVARVGVDKQEGDVRFNVTRAYWSLKWSRAAEGVLSEVRPKLTGWIQKINDEIETGKSSYTEDDLTRLRLALDSAEMTILDVRRAGTLALTAIRQLLSEPEADIDESEIDLNEIALEPVEHFQDAARLHRPESRQLHAGEAAVAAQEHLRLADLLPDVGIAGSFTYGYAQSVDNPLNAFFNHPNTLGAGLALAIRTPLDIPLKLARLDEAKAQRRAFMAQKIQAQQGIVIDIQRAYSEAADARERARLLAHSEKVARGWYNAVDQSLQIGLGDSRNLVDAARNYFEVRLRRLQAMMEANVALAGLRNAAGLK